MYTVAGAAIVTSLISIVLFLAFFGLSYFSFSLQSSFNEWLYEVEDMTFWFNRSFMTWLFIKHPERWAKWQTGVTLLIADWFDIPVFWFVSSRLVFFETAVLGVAASIPITVIFSYTFYKSFVSKIGENAS